MLSVEKYHAELFSGRDINYVKKVIEDFNSSSNGKVLVVGAGLAGTTAARYAASGIKKGYN
jgi:NADPH-dependent 2,4-dienoyl-CoA reductase/sulfur reductase-like enzyme